MPKKALMDYKQISFDRTANADFIKTVQKRVRKHFKTTGVSRFGNTEMVIKSVILISVYLAPYFLMLTHTVTNSWGVIGLWCVMGVGMAGVGFSVMHDACHGSYSKHDWINKIVGDIIILVGGNAVNWKTQHNVLHHTYTNVMGVDEDIDTSVLRLSPHQDWKKMHKNQHVYAWFLYGLMTLMWSTTKDFKQISRYNKVGLLKQQNVSYAKEMTKLILSKIVYYALFLVVPLMFFPGSWWVVLIGYLLMHYIAGFFLAIVFQPAHVLPSTKFPRPNKEGTIENNWAVHQMETTSNFAHDNKLLSWYVGGLNYQVEHHLFPNICHVHYKHLSKIVKKTAEEFNLPYHNEKTFMLAVKKHGQLLKKLGKGKYFEEAHS